MGNHLTSRIKLEKAWKARSIKFQMLDTFFIYKNISGKGFNSLIFYLDNKEFLPRNWTLAKMIIDPEKQHLRNRLNMRPHVH